ncbi:hypothetical protein EX30DRAFT_343885 [Ascodesmis nigricans]|uniref:Uncharacterized protein n=1 Tax=Ascodesmis nigricans TaxID=341454 RepID=A0A4S2MKZ8_9PEZI|nr:hypothetical protein EX30DRAFT_343885 [Ascodesmis nigricans]
MSPGSQPQARFCGDRVLSLILGVEKFKYYCQICDSISGDPVCRKCNHFYDGLISSQYVDWRCWACGVQGFTFMEYGIDQSIRRPVYPNTCLECKYPRDAACVLVKRELLFRSRREPRRRGPGGYLYRQSFE